MSLLKVSRLARGGVVQRLANSVTGLNPFLTEALTDAGLTTPPAGLTWTVPITFTSTSKNFFQADVGPDDFTKTTSFTYPFLTCFAIENANKNLEKFATFSGPVTIALNVFVTWSASRALQDMETVMDCFEESIIRVFNSSEKDIEHPPNAVIADWPHFCDDRLVYNGEISTKRGQLETNVADSWRQPLYARLMFEVHSI